MAKGFWQKKHFCKKNAWLKCWWNWFKVSTWKKQTASWWDVVSVWCIPLIRLCRWGMGAATVGWETRKGRKFQALSSRERFSDWTTHCWQHCLQFGSKLMLHPCLNREIYRKLLVQFWSPCGTSHVARARKNGKSGKISFINQTCSFLLPFLCFYVKIFST